MRIAATTTPARRNEWLSIFAFLPAAIVLVTTSSPAQAYNADFEEGDGALSSGTPRIPEPLLFDLVRPLGASKGELEMNALVEHSLEGEIEWAPEIEYAFADGYAIELELPFDDLSLTEYKLAFQGTFGTLWGGGRMIHGWQVIGYHERRDKVYSGDALYLNGIRFSDEWSTFNMFGVRRTDFAARGDFVGLLNNSLFYDYSQQLTLGFEINSEIDHRLKWRYRLVPQVHYDFSTTTTLQLGGGPSKLTANPGTDWVVAWRLIYAF